MSHGDGNVTRVSENVSSGGDGGGKISGGADEFGRAVARVAVAQVCEGVGFQGSKESALDALADISIRYLCDLGKTASFCANLTGRTECNVFDIIRALEVLELSQGFPGAADTGRCLAGSGTMKELVRFVDLAEEIPFAQPVASFPIVKSRRSVPSFSRIGEDPPGQHIPAWLPALPDPHTYLRSPTWNERKTDPREDKIEQIRQRRKAERSLFSLQQRLVSSSGGGDGNGPLPSLPLPPTTKQAEGKNPFLEPPLRPGEKEVSPVVRPPKLVDEVGEDDGDQGSVLQAFGPAIEAVKNGFCDDGEDERRAVLPEPDTRPAVHFKFRTAKKYLVESTDLCLKKKGVERPGYWFARDEERDDKKRRAEFILRQSIENPQELNQM